MLQAVNGHKTYVGTFLSVAAALLSIQFGIEHQLVGEFLRAFAIVAAGIAVAGLRHAIQKIPDAMLIAIHQATAREIDRARHRVAAAHEVPSPPPGYVADTRASG